MNCARQTERWGRRRAHSRREHELINRVRCSSISPRRNRSSASVASQAAAPDESGNWRICCGPT